MTMQILIGADPELFVKKDGKLVTGHGLIPGDKDNPHKVDGGAVQVDGMALEFNIDPAADLEGFMTNIRKVMKALEDMVPGHTLHAQPVAHFGKEYLSTMPEEALVLGCEPDFDAHNKGKANPRPDGDVDFRTGGGHVHIGWTEDMDVNDPEHIEACIMLVRELDYYLGLPSLFWDKEDGRRKMYGQAGAFRVKPYGVEYRSLSNAWLSSPELMELVYHNTRLAVENLLEGKSIWNRYTEVARRAMKNNDRELAMSALDICFPDSILQKLKVVGV